jgi:hypothetical protein
MACRRQCLRDAGRIGGGNGGGKREGGQAVRLGCILANLVEFALQVLLRDLHLSQGQANVFVAEQLHERREADSQPQPVGGVGMSQPRGVT